MTFKYDAVSPANTLDMPPDLNKCITADRDDFAIPLSDLDICICRRTTSNGCIV